MSAEDEESDWLGVERDNPRLIAWREYRRSKNAPPEPPEAAPQPNSPAPEIRVVQPIPCPKCNAPIFVREDSTIVSHYNAEGDRCTANETKIICDCHLHENQVCDVCQGVAKIDVPSAETTMEWAQVQQIISLMEKVQKQHAEIAQLRAEIERRDEWISVDDRLPDGEEMVLTYGFSDALRVIYWRQEVARYLSPDELKYWNNGHIKPTHWRPLPAPPEKPHAEISRIAGMAG